MNYKLLLIDLEVLLDFRHIPYYITSSILIFIVPNYNFIKRKLKHIELLAGIFYGQIVLQDRGF